MAAIAQSIHAGIHLPYFPEFGGETVGTALKHVYNIFP
jgi:hypothetical protein